jgi:hypothetical protein
MKKDVMAIFKNSVMSRESLKYVIGGSNLCCSGVGNCVDCTGSGCSFNHTTKCMGCTGNTANTCSKNSNFWDDSSS